MSVYANLPNALGMPGPRFIQRVVRKWSPDKTKHIGNVLMPERGSPFETIEWDEKQPVLGLTSAHQLGTEPKAVKHRVRKHQVERTAHWKEFQRLDESDMNRIRAEGNYNRLAGQDAVVSMSDYLNGRLDARMEQLRWAAINGTVTISENGVIRTITYGVPSTITPGTAWSTVASANPIADLQSAALTLRGKGGRPTCYYNRKVATYLAQNATVRDLLKQSQFAMNLGPGNVGNALSSLVGDMDFVLYDEGYLAESDGAFTPFIGDTKVYLIAAPPEGQQLGAFVSTPSVHNGGLANPQPGRFALPEDKTQSEKNPYYDLTVGIYGIPIIEFPECIQSLTVAS